MLSPTKLDTMVSFISILRAPISYFNMFSWLCHLHACRKSLILAPVTLCPGRMARGLRSGQQFNMFCLRWQNPQRQSPHWPVCAHPAWYCLHGISGETILATSKKTTGLRFSKLTRAPLLTWQCCRRRGQDRLVSWWDFLPILHPRIWTPALCLQRDSNILI